MQNAPTWRNLKMERKGEERKLDSWWLWKSSLATNLLTFQLDFLPDTELFGESQGKKQNESHYDRPSSDGN